MTDHPYTDDDLRTEAASQHAADVSEWAVNLGADGLEPCNHALTLGTDEKPIARIHFAFEPGMPDEERTALIHGLGQVIANSM